MQDRFKFRGLKNGQWYYGAYLKHLPYTPQPIREYEIPEKDFKHLIIKDGFSDWGLPRDIKAVEIEPATIGQCTGLKDKNGKLIFEGDIVRMYNNCIDNLHIVKFGDFAMFDFDFQEDYEKGSTAVYGWYLGGQKYPIPLSISLETSGMQIEVIGNIYENADLLGA